MGDAINPTAIPIKNPANAKIIPVDLFIKIYLPFFDKKQMRKVLQNPTHLLKGIKRKKEKGKKRNNQVYNSSALSELLI